MFFTTYFLAALLLAAAAIHAAPNCPPLGPVFERPTDLSRSQAIRDAVANLTSTLTARDGDNATTANTTSYSLQVFSISSERPVFEWYHTAPTVSTLNTTGVKKVDQNTVYRLGSLTKIFTIYTWLAQDGDKRFNEPITKYIPELAAVADKAKSDPLTHVAWDDVTIGSLASQLSGAVRDCNQEFNQSRSTELGFPPLNSSDSTFPTCGEYPLCNRTEFFKGLVQVYPSYAPFTTPAYTNTGFQILSYALESIKGKSFKSMLQESILRPLGLNHTFYDSAPEEDGIIPGNTTKTSWPFQLGDESPAGNMYSSVADIAALGRSIMSSKLLPLTVTQRWLKPAALTSELLASVGYPWGIRRVVIPEENGKRVVDAYTKAGRIGYYTSIMTLLPDYGIGITVLLAGPEVPGNAHFTLADILGTRLLPALEQAAREQAEAKYGGIYRSETLNSSLEIRTQPDRPGLGIFNWVSNGTDMEYISMALQGGYQPANSTVRLYPTGLESTKDDGSKRISFKATFEDPSAPSRPNDMFSTDCGTWVAFTGVTYGSQPLDEFIFNIDKDGKVLGVESPALRVTLKKGAK
ncbi:beta-lactamase/transpeptidase-like protein [Thozetella sp. PMI_491]|nr:beta-lactamase/transpeptidase-like protein [Thozetella sp. PMI_491]